ncbi:OFA family MFS transporter [Saccharopolyspora sp. 6M]|uniref:L-lactate MFS transporter n=1 Tax=Saccharopolyspora sp. 6M TaxID=2877237 RepID=UPI001CD19B44|nr:OFA family MFS transporter [Saccharopolyspora sp. 6M]MCA1226634.1 OFA family MFS transporter [Saccharopolyspora sp. 6M]
MTVRDGFSVVAPPTWNRWLVPPAALAIHLSIGQAYAWSVFKSPLESSLQISGTGSALPFQVAIFFLGLSAAFGGKFVESRGPRWAMLVSTIAFASGFLISALGMYLGQYWLVVVGYGVVGGIGLGIGYIAPVSTLMKWFPDRPGLATGIAIMGFGGGAIIASPWSTAMLDAFGKTTSGIGSTFLVHGIVYAVFMTLGILLVRVPPPGWTPPGWTPAAAAKSTNPIKVSANNALRTPQFWLLWIVLCLNVTAGIGILQKASPMIQDFFAGTSTPVAVAAATGFVSLLSLANMGGRFAWSALSDRTGRKNIYRVYLGVGALAYLLLLFAGDSSVALFVVAAMLIMSFYGAGFATIPAYLKDLFGTFEVGAIHGRLLTAWSVAGVLGPAIVDALADSGEAAGKSGADLYTVSFYLMTGALVIGFVANELIRPVHSRFYEPEQAAAEAESGSGDAAETAESESADSAKSGQADADDSAAEKADESTDTAKASSTSGEQSS